MNDRRSQITYICFSILLFAQFLAAVPAQAQHGQAEAGYYPAAFVGDTWAGNVTAMDDRSRTITLTYVKGSKTQTFTLRFATGLAVNYTDGTSKELKPSDIPNGASALAYYTNFSEKVGGKKTDVHEVFMLRVQATDGKEHTYKTPFDPKLKSWGTGGIQVTGAAERPE